MGYSLTHKAGNRRPTPEGKTMGYGIYCKGRGWVESINPVSGTPTWTKVIYDAFKWADRQRAEEMADGIGSVCVLV